LCLVVVKVVVVVVVGALLLLLLLLLGCFSRWRLSAVKGISLPRFSSSSRVLLSLA